MTSLLGITLFVLALMLAIFLHEGGHFATAKLFGMKVERFFLGFGPTLWSFRRGETEYGVKAFPLGGFCKIAGMSPYENDGNCLEEDRSGKPAAAPTPPERQFRNKPAWQRAIVLAAGSITHFIVAILLIWMVLVAIGIGTGQVTTTIDNTVALDGGQRSPAQIAGLKSGDQIVAVAGTPVSSFEQLRAVGPGQHDPNRIVVGGNVEAVVSNIDPIAAQNAKLMSKRTVRAGRQLEGETRAADGLGSSRSAVMREAASAR